MGKRTWTDKQLAEAVKTSVTAAETIRKLGLSLRPGNYPTVRKHITRLGLDTSHWQPNAIRIRKLIQHNTIPLEEILVENSNYDRSRLKKRLIKKKLLDYKCSICQLKDWNNKSISLQLDHINGNSRDHRLENLRLLCPNCHSQTDNFCRKKTKAKKRKKKERKTKINWPPATEILETLQTESYTAISKQLGVSDNAVRKYLKRTTGDYPRKHKGLVV